MTYNGRNVLITGGLGFIGSNLALALAEEDARVTIVDNLLPGCGGNLHNLARIRNSIRLIEEDIADADRFRSAIAESEIIFNLAGEVSHTHSMQFPERDLQVNTIAQLRFLLVCKEAAPRRRIVYASTRQVYGVPRYLPVDEAHPIQPVDFNGIHKYAATQYHQMLTRAGQIDAMSLRLTNVYGPRMALDVVCQGFLSTYFRKAALGERLDIFGDGSQLRDPLYVTDAVEAFRLAGLIDRPAFRTYNVGGGETLSLAQTARLISKLGGCPEPVLVPFPPGRKVIDIGSYRTDSGRFQRDCGWRPHVSFEAGVAKTLAFYQLNLDDYLDRTGLPAPCRMPEHSGAPHKLTYAKA